MATPISGGAGAVNFRREADRARRNERLAPFTPELVDKGEIHNPQAEPAPAGYATEIRVFCPLSSCGAELRAVRYNVFVNAEYLDQASRVMVVSTGTCPSCMTQRSVIWDPMPYGSAEEEAKLKAEREDLMRTWLREMEESV